jgi:carboxymethylenebutenolidase
MKSDQPDGYLATPPSGKGNGVLVLHAWWGLNNVMKEFCDRLANNGFTAFAPDLYHSKIADKIADAEAISSTLDSNQAMIEIMQSTKFLIEQTGQANPRLAVIGFSLGAAYALDLSVTDPENIRSVVIFYGTGPGDFRKSKASYLGHFAETDDFEPSSEVNKLEQALRQAGRPVEFYNYPNTGHWFFEHDRLEAFKEEAAILAWERTLNFLKRQPTK